MPVTGAISRTTDEWQVSLGESLRDARLARRLDQKTLASLADISERSLRNAESGEGSSLSTIIKLVRALDREDWLAAFDEGAGEPSPLELLRQSRGRQAKPRRAPRQGRA